MLDPPLTTVGKTTLLHDSFKPSLTCEYDKCCSDTVLHQKLYFIVVTRKSIHEVAQPHLLVDGRLKKVHWNVELK